MAAESNSKAEIVRRIRKANGSPSPEAVVRSGWSAISRNYKSAGVLAPEALLELFEGRLRDYDATVIRTGRAHLALSVAHRLQERCKLRILIPFDVPQEWLPEGVEFVVDDDLTPAELDSFDGVLTGSTLAIAETGTLVLQNAPAQGRRAVSLVPDYHLCVVHAQDLVETVPEAMKRLQKTAELATTFISGPSATADIEMTRIKGVHGPRVLDVLLIL